MKKALLVIALVALVVGLPILSACTCGGTQLTEGDIKTIKGFAARLDGLEASVSSLNSKVNALTPADLTQINADIAALRADLEALKASDNSSIAALETRVAALEDELSGSGGNGTTEPITARWQPIIDLEVPSSDVVIDYSWYPTRIKDEDTYRLTIDIANSGAAKTNQILLIILTPSSRDTSVDTSNTGLYSVSPIGIWWDVKYSPSDGVDCRRIEFVSDKFTLDAGDSTIKVDFDLYYD